MHQHTDDPGHSDVLLVGAGPVGPATALFLGQDGWRDTVLERRPAPCPQPRAVHFDDEVARLLADGLLARVRTGAGRLSRQARVSYRGRTGRLSRQARVSYRGRTGLLDDVAGRGFVVASTTGPRTVLSACGLAFLDRIGARVLHLVPPGTRADEEVAAVDVDGFYVPHFTEDGLAGVVVRPDHCLFGTAATPDDFAQLVDDLEEQLTSPQAAPPQTAVTASAFACGSAR